MIGVVVGVDQVRDPVAHPVGRGDLVHGAPDVVADGGRRVEQDHPVAGGQEGRLVGAISDPVEVPLDPSDVVALLVERRTERRRGIGRSRATRRHSQDACRRAPRWSCHVRSFGRPFEESESGSGRSRYRRHPGRPARLVASRESMVGPTRDAAEVASREAGSRAASATSPRACGTPCAGGTRRCWG